jgi:hypothetical protein
MTASIVSSFAKRLLGMTRCAGRSAFSSIALGFVCLAIFTHALRDALDADVNRNGLIEVSELADFEAFKLCQIPQRNIVGNAAMAWPLAQRKSP